MYVYLSSYICPNLSVIMTVDPLLWSKVSFAVRPGAVPPYFPLRAAFIHAFFCAFI